MTLSYSDIYKRGSAVAQGLHAEDFESLTDQEARDFKDAFIETLPAYLYKSEQDNRDWIIRMIGVITECVAAGKTFEETRAQIYDLAQALGRVSRLEIH